MMLISPTKAIDQGWVTGDIDDGDIQPNGLDFRLSQLFTAAAGDLFILGSTTRKHREFAAVEPYDFNFEGQTEPAFCLQPLESYDFISNLRVKLPQGVSATVVTRSTLNRNGLFLTAGWYDSGYNGLVGACLHNGSSGAAVISQNARVGQLLFYESATARMYDGVYNQPVEHWK